MENKTNLKPKAGETWVNTLTGIEVGIEAIRNTKAAGDTVAISQFVVDEFTGRIICETFGAWDVEKFMARHIRRGA